MEKRKCFVISPIGAEGTPTRKHADSVFFIIKMALCMFRDKYHIEIEPIRADNISEPGKITSQIYKEILKDNLCIVDLSEDNANVYYELGIAHALGRPVILLAEQSEALPFDIRDMRRVPFELKSLHS